jgi:hypothetical protein
MVSANWPAMNYGSLFDNRGAGFQCDEREGIRPYQGG